MPLKTVNSGKIQSAGRWLRLLASSCNISQCIGLPYVPQRMRMMLYSIGHSQYTCTYAAYHFVQKLLGAMATSTLTIPAIQKSKQTKYPLVATLNFPTCLITVYPNPLFLVLDCYLARAGLVIHIAIHKESCRVLGQQWRSDDSQNPFLYSTSCFQSTTTSVE